MKEKNGPIRAYKLVRRRKNGTLAPLFIDRRHTYVPGVWDRAKPVRTKGFAYRPGFHCTAKMEAPHLKLREDRVWCEVEIEEFEEEQRPPSQGGLWYLAQRMRVLKTIEQENFT